MAADTTELTLTLARLVELAAQLVEALARLEAGQEQTNRLLADLNRTQWS